MSFCCACARRVVRRQTGKVEVFHAFCDVCVCPNHFCEQGALLRAQRRKVVHSVVGLPAFSVGALFVWEIACECVSIMRMVLKDGKVVRYV